MFDYFSAQFQGCDTVAKIKQRALDLKNKISLDDIIGETTLEQTFNEIFDIRIVNRRNDAIGQYFSRQTKPLHLISDKKLSSAIIINLELIRESLQIPTTHCLENPVLSTGFALSRGILTPSDNEPVDLVFKYQLDYDIGRYVLIMEISLPLDDEVIPIYGFVQSGMHTYEKLTIK